MEDLIRGTHPYKVELIYETDKGLVAIKGDPDFRVTPYKNYGVWYKWLKGDKEVGSVREEIAVIDDGVNLTFLQGSIQFRVTEDSPHGKVLMYRCTSPIPRMLLEYLLQHK